MDSRTNAATALLKRKRDAEDDWLKDEFPPVKMAPVAKPLCCIFRICPKHKQGKVLMDVKKDSTEKLLSVSA